MNRKLILLVLTIGLFFALPMQPLLAFELSNDEYNAILAGNNHAPVGDIERCGAEQASIKTPGPVYILGDQTIASDSIKQKLEESFSSSLWSVEVNAEGRRSFKDANTPAVLTNEVKDKILEAKHIVVALGGYERSFPSEEKNSDRFYLEEVQKELRQMINQFENLRTPDATLYLVNVGSSADGFNKSGEALEGSEFRPETPARFSRINKDMNSFSNEANYRVVNWYKYVFGQDTDETQIDTSLEDTKGLLLDNKYSLSDEGESAWVEMISESITGSANAIDESGDLDNVNSSAPVAGGVLEGKYQLPAARGGFGLEGDVAADGTLLQKNANPEDVGNSVALGNLAKEGQEYRDYYITMRWRYAAWKWDGSSSVGRGVEDVDWYGAKPRLVLVTNPGSGKSIIAAILESGPAPYAGSLEGEFNTPAYWQDYQVGTPEGYTGRVAGLTETGINALGAEQWMHGGPNGGDSRGAGSELLYSWAPDQNATPGPTSLSVSAIGCATGNTVNPNGLTFPLQDITKEVLLRGSTGPRGTLTWAYACREDPGGAGKCHHDYNASDIHAPEGWPVIAMKEGTVQSARDAYDSAGGRLQIRGSDGFLYYYSHLDPSSIPQKFLEGNSVSVAAGEYLGDIGAPRFAAEAAPHVHVDLLPESEPGRPNCSGAECVGVPFLDIQSILGDMWESIPDA